MIDIVIPCYERNQKLDACVESIHRHTHHAFKLIIVEGKRSAAANRNKGISQVTSDWFVMIDDDAQVTDRWLDTLLPFREDKVGQIQPKVVFPDGRIFSAGVYRSRPMNIGFEEVDEGQYDVVAGRDCLNGCCSLYNSAILDTCGFDEKYKGSQCEDMDFSNQIVRAGFKLLFCGLSTVVHDSLCRESNIDENLKRYLWKWYGPRSARAKTNRGVLYCGYPCQLNCEFCYYQEKIRSGKFTSFSALKEDVRKMREELNLKFVDITGGEPTLHPRIIDLVEHCCGMGLEPSIITNAQKLADQAFARSLVNAGVTDFLISFHGPREIHNSVSGQGNRVYDIMREGIENVKTLGVPLRFNTVVTANTVESLEVLAVEIIEAGAMSQNFINFNPFHTWEASDGLTNFMAPYELISPRIRRAVSLLQTAGIEVNLRYFPFCQLKGLESLIMNFPQLPYDRWEWDFRTNNRGVMDPESFIGVEAIVRNHQKKWYTYDRACKSCSLHFLCDGISKNYAARYGFDELKPYSGPPLTDVLIFSAAFPVEGQLSSKKIKRLQEPLFKERLRLMPERRFVQRVLRKLGLNE